MFSHKDSVKKTAPLTEPQLNRRYAEPISVCEHLTEKHSVRVTHAVDFSRIFYR